MWTADTIILKERNYQTFDELMNDKLYMRFLLVSLITEVVVNIYLVIVLSVCQGRAIHGLKKHFGVAFRKETTQISRVLITFTITFFIRAVYEGVLSFRNIYNAHHFPC